MWQVAGLPRQWLGAGREAPCHVISYFPARVHVECGAHRDGQRDRQRNVHLRVFSAECVQCGVRCALVARVKTGGSGLVGSGVIR
eukprot:4363853-Prymnesium_polylepis.1